MVVGDDSVDRMYNEIRKKNSKKDVIVTHLNKIEDKIYTKYPFVYPNFEIPNGEKKLNNTLL